MPQKYQINFFYIVFGLVSLLTLLIFLPYLAPLVLAGVMSIVFFPLYQKMYKYLWKKQNLSALITSLLVFLIILVPLVILALLIANEIRSAYIYMTDEGGSLVVIDFLDHLQVFLSHYLPQNWVPEITLTDLERYLSNIYIWFANHYQSIASNVLAITGNAFVFVVAFYFFLRDGKKVKDILKRLSPLNDEHDENIITKVIRSVNSIVKGTLLVAVVEGILSMISFWIAGAPSPILLGTIAMIASLVPGLSTIMVTIPVSIIIFFTSGVWWAIGILVWGVIVIGGLENLIRPLVLEKGVNIHPFLIFISVFGGISFFGISGVIMGPIILSILYALSEVYSEVNAQKSSQVSSEVNKG